MGLFPGLLFGAPPAPPASDSGDANVWIGTGATHYDQIASALSQASAGDVLIASDQTYRAQSDGTGLRPVRSEVYAGTSPTLRGFVDGDEANDTELAANLGTLSITGTGSTAYDGTRVTLAWSSASTGGRDGVTADLGFAPTPSTGLYFGCRIATTGTGSTYQHGMQAYDGSDLIWLMRNHSFQSGSWAGLNDGFVLSAETTPTEQYVEGLIMPDRRAMIWIDGELVWAGVLDTANGTAAQVNWVAYDGNQVSAGSGSQTVRNLAIWSWT